MTVIKVHREEWHAENAWPFVGILTPGGFLLCPGGPNSDWAKPRPFQGVWGMLPQENLGKMELIIAILCLLAVKTEWLQCGSFTKIRRKIIKKMFGWADLRGRVGGFFRPPPPPVPPPPRYRPDAEYISHLGETKPLQTEFRKIRPLRCIAIRNSDFSGCRRKWLPVPQELHIVWKRSTRKQQQQQQQRQQQHKNSNNNNNKQTNNRKATMAETWKDSIVLLFSRLWHSLLLVYSKLAFRRTQNFGARLSCS